MNAALARLGHLWDQIERIFTDDYEAPNAPLGAKDMLLGRIDAVMLVALYVADSPVLISRAQVRAEIQRSAG